MKREIRNPLRIFAAVLAIAAGTCLTNVGAFADDDVCTVTTLHGSYGIQSTGSIVALGPIGPIAEAGTITFDGAGGVSQITTVSIALADRLSLTGLASAAAIP